MKSTSIINQIETGDKTVGSNPTPSVVCGYNDLRKEQKPQVTPEPRRNNYQLINLNNRGGYESGPEARLWHPDAAVRAAWFRQDRGES